MVIAVVVWHISAAICQLEGDKTMKRLGAILVMLWLLTIFLFSSILLRCQKNPLSASEWRNNIESQISHVDFNLEYLENITSRAIGTAVFGLQFFIEFKIDPKSFGIDSMEVVSSSDPNFTWKTHFDTTRISGNIIYSRKFIATFMDFGSYETFPLGYYDIIFYSQGRACDITRSVYRRNAMSLTSGLDPYGGPNQILAIPFIKSVTTNSDSILIDLYNRDSLSIHCAELHIINSAGEFFISSVDLPSKPGFSEYNLAFKKPTIKGDTVCVKVFSKVLPEYDSDYLANSHPIRLSDGKVIPNYWWDFDTTLQSR
jgi:hypothetical protein